MVVNADAVAFPEFGKGLGGNRGHPRAPVRERFRERLHLLPRSPVRGPPAAFPRPLAGRHVGQRKVHARRGAWCVPSIQALAAIRPLISRSGPTDGDRMMAAPRAFSRRRMRRPHRSCALPAPLPSLPRGNFPLHLLPCGAKRMFVSWLRPIDQAPRRHAPGRHAEHGGPALLAQRHLPVCPYRGGGHGPGGEPGRERGHLPGRDRPTGHRGRVRLRRHARACRRPGPTQPRLRPAQQRLCCRTARW